MSDASDDSSVKTASCPSGVRMFDDLDTAPIAKNLFTAKHQKAAPLDNSAAS
jgi:hypothetical protein